MHGSARPLPFGNATKAPSCAASSAVRRAGMLRALRTEHRKWDWSGADRSDGSGRARTIEFKPDAAPGSTKGDFPRTAPRLFPGRSQVQIRTPLRLEGPPEGRVVLGQRSAVGPGVVAAP